MMSIGELKGRRLRKINLISGAVVAVAAGFGCGPDGAARRDEGAAPRTEQPTGSPASAEFIERAQSLQKSFAEREQYEAMRMLDAVMRAARIGPGEGWFGPAQSRYTWDWLARAHGLNTNEPLANNEFRGRHALFERLDRDRNGWIVSADLDWSVGSRYVQDFRLTSGILARIDKQGDGRLTPEEWLALYEKAAAERGGVTPACIAELLLAAPDANDDDLLTPDKLLGALERGEIGSFREGPNVNEPAPDFELQTHDGKRTIRLSELRGAPVVLVFGNYTCGPFRKMFPRIDDLARRYRDEAEFLAVYVRETHPSDGFRMKANERQGVRIAQPTTYDQRVAAAQRCHAAFQPSMPLLVDELDDPVSENYSGRPIRLYVIDRQGKVAYKGGRGPFGFDPGELEQALVMALLEKQMQLAASE